MNFYRLEAIPQETLYAVANDEKDVMNLSNNPICFSPVSYRIEEVGTGDIPITSKIVSIDSDGRISRVSLQKAMQIAGMSKPDIVSDIEAAITNLREVMIRHGLHGPSCIQLHDADQAMKIISAYGSFIAISQGKTPDDCINGNCIEIHGVKISWPSKCPD